ncbi:murein hydrolase activator EnvC family protein [Arthrobacter sp.]|uniref:murein hydrolase activator EnvC family protein n=1 Tax=Arthrobacter sp. TaxID=1667 RepID=UPI003A951D76
MATSISRFHSTAVLLVCCLFAAGPASAVAPRPPTGESPAPVGAWAWPLGGPDDLLAVFDRPESPWSAGHRGVDLTSSRGARVHSPAAGVVAFVGIVVDRPVVTVDHGNGLVSSFEPALATVEVGDVVSRGQVVAGVHAGGHCSDACLHWGVRLNGEYIDPLSLVMDRRPSVLLPIPSATGRTWPDGRRQP